MDKISPRAQAIPRRIRRRELPVIGWREHLALPTLGIDSIKAKIDTGARTSSLHAFDLHTFTDQGRPWVSFVVHPAQRRRQPAITCTAEILDERTVTSSDGDRHRRFAIRVEIVIGGVLWPIELTLANRDEMGFRMLLGREALRGRFLVDAQRSFIAGRSHAAISTVSRNKKRK